MKTVRKIVNYDKIRKQKCEPHTNPMMFASFAKKVNLVSMTPLRVLLVMDLLSIL